MKQKLQADQNNVPLLVDDAIQNTMLQQPKA